MNENEIRSIFIKENKFKGCYALDEVQGIMLLKNNGIIMNTVPRHIKSGHWVAFYRDVDNNFYCIDSLTLPDFLENPYLKIFFNVNKVTFLNKLHHPIQPLNSSMCGLYASYFLVNLFKGEKFSNLVNRFDIVNLFVNEYIVTQYFMNM